jgi:uncharacterized protein YcbX
MHALVHACHVYPVKACGGMPVPALELDAQGRLTGDREWVVVDEEGTVTWQGAHPRLARLHALLHEGALHLAAEDGGRVRLHAAQGERPAEARCWNDLERCFETLAGDDAGDEVARFVAEVVGARLRLLRPHTARHRVNPLHVVTLPSWQELQAQIGPAADGAAQLLRLRPNLVLAPSADDELPPFIEEHAVALQVGAQRFELYAPCIRCVVPNVDPRSGAVDPAFLAAMTTLSAQRFPGGPVRFGLYARAAAGAHMACGDTVFLELDFR